MLPARHRFVESHFLRTLQTGSSLEDRQIFFSSTLCEPTLISHKKMSSTILATTIASFLKMDHFTSSKMLKENGFHLANSMD